MVCKLICTSYYRCIFKRKERNSNDDGSSSPHANGDITNCNKSHTNNLNLSGKNNDDFHQIDEKQPESEKLLASPSAAAAAQGNENVASSATTINETITHTPEDKLVQVVEDEREPNLELRPLAEKREVKVTLGNDNDASGQV